VAEEWDDFYTDFQAALTQIEDRALPAAAEMIYRILARIQETLSVIPEQPARDRARGTDSKGREVVHFNTYVRNIGNFPKSAFVQVQRGDKAGQWKRKKTGAYDQGKVRYTSEQSSKRWGIYVNEGDHEITGELRNDASYSGWVFGTIDQSMTLHQVPWHTLTGWTYTEQAIEITRTDVDAMLAEQVTQIVEMLSRGQG
jgi:hypothetical protein